MDKSLGQSRRGQVGRLLLVGALSLWALVWFSLNVCTAPVGLLWHLFHGNSTSFEGHTIRVPWDMWVEGSSDGTLTIIRAAAKYPILRSPAGIMLIQRTPGRAADMSKDYDRIARTNEQAPKGYRLQGVRQVSAAKGTGYCWELVRLDSSYLSISCWFDKDTLAASYGGSPVYRDPFYRVLTVMSGVSSGASP